MLPAEEAASRAGMRRSSESIPTTGGLIRTTRVQTFIPISTVLPLQHVRLSHKNPQLSLRRPYTTATPLPWRWFARTKVSERKATGAPSFYTLAVDSHAVHFCDTACCRTGHRNAKRRDGNCCHNITTLTLGHPTRNQIGSRQSQYRCSQETLKHRSMCSYYVIRNAGSYFNTLECICYLFVT